MRRGRRDDRAGGLRASAGVACRTAPTRRHAGSARPPRAWTSSHPEPCRRRRSRRRRTATAPRACGRSPTRPRPTHAVANIRNRGRLIVGLDIGSNLFCFRDPITGEITGFDVDIAGEVARDIFGTPSQVEYRILSSADRIAALQNNQVDIVVKTMTHHL